MQVREGPVTATNTLKDTFQFEAHNQRKTSCNMGHGFNGANDTWGEYSMTTLEIIYTKCIKKHTVRH